MWKCRLMWKATPVAIFFLLALMAWLDPPGVILFKWISITQPPFLGFLLHWSGALALGLQLFSSKQSLSQHLLIKTWVFQFNFVSKSDGVCGWSVLMDINNQRPAQGGEPSMEAGDWRSQVHPDSRRRIVRKITETLKRHLLSEGEEGLRELENLAVMFEEKTYVAASSQSDYLRKISLKMLTMEIKSGVSPTPPSNLKRHRVRA